jgi:glycine cleavage system H protein
MAVPNDRKYLESHEWHQPNGDIVTIGITQNAADELTDITFVALPKVGDALQAASRFGEVESVKATSDLYSGVSGTVAEVNEAVTKDPSIVNNDPYHQGWMIRVKTTKSGEMEKLLSAEQYEQKIGH